MKSTKSKILSYILTCTLVLALFAGVGSVTASASEAVSPDDVDYYGENICDSMEEYLIRWCSDFFGSELQLSREVGTIVFVDYQLIEYGITDHLCQALNNSGVFETTLYWGNIYQNTGILFLVHYDGYAFYDLETSVTNGSYMGYDFSGDSHYEFLNNCIGEVNMCALGVWQPCSDLYTFLMDVQDLWHDNFPIYFIYRDPISLGDSGLLFRVYDSIEKVFYYCYDAPGATY